MKKVLSFILLSSLILVAFTGCSKEPYPFKEPINEIDSVEIVSAENSLNYTVIKTLSETEKNNFLEQFQKIKFQQYLGDPPGVHGNSIKITYQSGVYEIICYYSAEYVEDGVPHFLWEYCDEEDFNKLISNFLE